MEPHSEARLTIAARLNARDLDATAFDDEAHARESGKHDAAAPLRTVGVPGAQSRPTGRRPKTVAGNRRLLQAAARAVEQAGIGVHACCRDNCVDFRRKRLVKYSVRLAIGITFGRWLYPPTPPQMKGMCDEFK